MDRVEGPASGTPRPGRRLFWTAVAVHLVALYSPRAVPEPSAVLGWDKLAHMALFGVVLWLGVRAGLSWRWLTAALVVNAVLSEGAQGVLMPQRSGDVYDLLADLLGLVVAGVLLRRSARRDASLAGAGR